MSEQQNVDQISRVYDAFGKGDIPYIIDQLTDDVRWISRFEPIVPWAGDYSSKTKVPGFFAAIGENVDVTAFNPDEFVAQGDTVVSMGEFGCKVKSTGKAALTRWVFIWKLRDGHIYSYEQFHDPSIAEAFRKG